MGKTETKKAEVRESFRHTHPNKATPEWSVPTKMYVIAEDLVAEPISTLWDQIGRQGVYPLNWQVQKTVWIPKARKKRMKCTPEEVLTSSMEEPKDIWCGYGKEWRESQIRTTGKMNTEQ